MTMTENDKIIRLKYKIEEQLNYIIRQKKVMQSYKEKTTEEMNKLKYDNKKLTNFSENKNSKDSIYIKFNFKF